MGQVRLIKKLNGPSGLSNNKRTERPNIESWIKLRPRSGLHFILHTRAGSKLDLIVSRTCRAIYLFSKNSNSGNKLLLTGLLKIYFKCEKYFQKPIFFFYSYTDSKVNIFLPSFFFYYKLHCFSSLFLCKSLRAEVIINVDMLHNLVFIITNFVILKHSIYEFQKGSF